jgi:hypothetical protein
MMGLKDSVVDLRHLKAAPAVSVTPGPAVLTPQPPVLTTPQILQTPALPVNLMTDTQVDTTHNWTLMKEACLETSAGNCKAGCGAARW